MYIECSAIPSIPSIKLLGVSARPTFDFNSGTSVLRDRQTWEPEIKELRASMNFRISTIGIGLTTEILKPILNHQKGAL